MGFHQRHTHGRVFRGLEAREQLHIHRRDSHGNTPIMRVPDGFDLQQKAADDPQIVSVVYVTLPQTFSGSAVYQTLTSNPNEVPAPTTDAHPTHSAAEHTPGQNGGQNGGKVTTSIAIATPVPQSEITSAAAMTSFATAIASSSVDVNQVSDSNSNPSVVAGSPLQATATPASQAINQGGSGLTSGAQAGLAFGIIAGVALAAGLLWFCWRRQKKVRIEDEVNNEKHASFADASARQVEAVAAKRGSSFTEKAPASVRSSPSNASRTTSTAPRLSLRPLTQFLPALPANNSSLDVSGTSLAETSKSSWERRPSNVGSNPFDDASSLSEKQARPNSPPQANPFDEQAAGAARRSPKMSMEGSEPSTPRSFQSGPGATPLPGAPGKENSPPRGPNNVHRVQLDFKPSMDDELELRSGQLVRMLHEYDDGWALCIRMDRSQQGVAPRTCLSKLPVKPRPQGPPPNSRPGTSHGPGPRGPPGPQMNGTMVPRPLTPTQANRTASPTETGREASNTVPHRKPVPGQAM